MMDASVATSGQNGMKASKVKAHVADLSKQVPDAEVLVKGKRRRWRSKAKPREAYQGTFQLARAAPNLTAR
jgi:hypothetical protein